MPIPARIIRRNPANMSGTQVAIRTSTALGRSDGNGPDCSTALGGSETVSEALSSPDVVSIWAGAATLSVIALAAEAFPASARVRTSSALMRREALLKISLCPSAFARLCPILRLCLKSRGEAGRQIPGDPPRRGRAAAIFVPALFLQKMREAPRRAAAKPSWRRISPFRSECRGVQFEAFAVSAAVRSLMRQERERLGRCELVRHFPVEKRLAAQVKPGGGGARLKFELGEVDPEDRRAIGRLRKNSAWRRCRTRCARSWRRCWACPGPPARAEPRSSGSAKRRSRLQVLDP